MEWIQIQKLDFLCIIKVKNCMHFLLIWMLNQYHKISSVCTKVNIKIVFSLKSCLILNKMSLFVFIKISQKTLKCAFRVIKLLTNIVYFTIFNFFLYTHLHDQNGPHCISISLYNLCLSGLRLEISFIPSILKISYYPSDCETNIFNNESKFN